MQRFSIVAKKDEKSAAIEQTIKEKLVNSNLMYDKENPDLVISVGGDGTLLYAVHQYITHLQSIHFIALHTGTLGFFTDYTENEVEEVIADILNHEIYEVFQSHLLEIEVDNKQTYYALNEMRIENVCKTQNVDIYIDDEFFETVKGNGVCLSTQAGATAYNRSLKGAVIDSGLEVLQLCEIAGIQNAKHTSLGSPYIMKNDRQISFISEDSSGAILCYDHLYFPIDDVKKITCKVSDLAVSFIRYKKYSYLERLRTLY